MIRIKYIFSSKISLLLTFLPLSLFGQSTSTDSIPAQQMDSITVSAYRTVVQRVIQLPDVYNMYLLAGKKSEVIQLSGMNANIAEKTGRQIFAKIPGVFVYDMDGSGNQINISTRGLDPHRSWEFNIRHNAVLVNSDMYGYPASHFNPPMESIERIEIVHSGALQYGAQFGGMINFVSKHPDTTRAIGFEQQSTVGSYGLFSSYSALGGQKGKLSYYAYYNRRVSDGYRKNSSSTSDAWMLQLNYQVTPKLNLKAELAHSEYRYQLPGPLTDLMFQADPQQASRSRNYYSPDMYVPSLTADWKINDRTQIRWINSAVYGTRSSVMFDRFATVADTINRVTGDYNSRQVDIDNFNSHTSELRVTHRYNIGQQEQVLAFGGQFMYNNMHRRQQGKGTTGFDYDLSRISPEWGRDMWYRTRNTAIFAENTFYPVPKLAISPGIRVETGYTSATGSISYYLAEDIPNKIEHQFALLGISAKYQIRNNVQWYAAWNQGYRPVIFKDIVPGSILERANKDLKDARGYTAETGIKGHSGKWLRYELSGFYLFYGNRMGNLILMDETTQENYIYKTNIGDSRTWGLENMVEITPVLRNNYAVSMFCAASWFDARYQNATVAAGGQNHSVDGNKVESVPDWIVRTGLNTNWQRWRASLLYSYVGDTYADALNTVAPSANGAIGLVPAYGLFDFSLSCRINAQFSIRGSVSNLTNKQYFTKRPAFYPGPGIWSSDGRTMQLSVTANL